MFLKGIGQMNLSQSLRYNAVFTALCGFACVIAPSTIAAHTALPDRLWVIGIGIMLLLYVPILLFAAARPMVWLVRTIIILDWSYVLIATTFFVFRWREMDMTGTLLVLISTILVATFAYLQQKGLAKFRKLASQ